MSSSARANTPTLCTQLATALARGTCRRTRRMMAVTAVAWTRTMDAIITHPTMSGAASCMRWLAPVVATARAEADQAVREKSGDDHEDRRRDGQDEDRADLVSRSGDGLEDARRGDLGVGFAHSPVVGDRLDRVREERAEEEQLAPHSCGESTGREAPSPIS